MIIGVVATRPIITRREHKHRTQSVPASLDRNPDIFVSHDVARRSEVIGKGTNRAPRVIRDIKLLLEQQRLSDLLVGPFDSGRYGLSIMSDTDDTDLVTLARDDDPRDWGPVVVGRGWRQQRRILVVADYAIKLSVVVQLRIKTLIASASLADQIRMIIVDAVVDNPNQNARS